MSQTPPPPNAKSSDVLVITRLNTVGLRRLAEGSLVEKSLDSRPPAMPSRPPEPPPRVEAAPLPKIEAPKISSIIDIDELMESDADIEDRTLHAHAQRRVDVEEERTVSIKTPSPAAMTAAAAAARRLENEIGSLAPLLEEDRQDRPTMDPPKLPSQPLDPRLEMETPTAMFVKDIQATLKEELAKQAASGAGPMSRTKPSAPPIAPVFELPPLDIAPLSEKSASPRAMKARSDAPPGFPKQPDLKLDRGKSVPPPPMSKPASLSAPPAKAVSSLPAPLPAQANRRKDPAGMSVSTRPNRIERKGGFLPWAAALTALGVFVGVAGARVATGGAFARSAAQPAAPTAVVAEPGFAPRVVVPTEVAKTAEQPAAPAETAKVEAAPAQEVAKAEPVKVELVKVEPVKVEPKPEPVKAEVKAEPKAEHVEARVERPRPRREAPRPAPVEKAEKPEPKPEPVAAKPAKAEKPEPAPTPAPAKPPSKSSDVAAAARDYAAVESQLGQSL